MGHGASGYRLASLALHPQQTEVFVFGDKNGTVLLWTPECKLCPQLGGAVLVHHWAGVLSTQCSPPGLCQRQLLTCSTGLRPFGGLAAKPTETS